MLVRGELEAVVTASVAGISAFLDLKLKESPLNDADHQHGLKDVIIGYIENCYNPYGSMLTQSTDLGAEIQSLRTNVESLVSSNNHLEEMVSEIGSLCQWGLKIPEEAYEPDEEEDEPEEESQVYHEYDDALDYQAARAIVEPFNPKPVDNNLKFNSTAPAKKKIKKKAPKLSPNGKKSNRGGSRPGAGRKSNEYHARMKLLAVENRRKLAEKAKMVENGAEMDSEVKIEPFYG